MRTLRTTTALVAGLAALIPTVLPAQQATKAAVEAEICVSDAIAAGSSEADARATCGAGDAEATPPAAATDPAADAAPATEPATDPAPESAAPADTPPEAAAPNAEAPEAAAPDAPAQDAAPDAEAPADAAAPEAEMPEAVVPPAAPEAAPEAAPAEPEAAPAEAPEAAAPAEAPAENAAPTEAAPAEAPATAAPDAAPQTDAQADPAQAPAAGDTAPEASEAPEGSPAPEAPAAADATTGAEADVQSGSNAETTAPAAESAEDPGVAAAAAAALAAALGAPDAAESGAAVENSALAAEADGAAGTSGDAGAAPAAAEGSTVTEEVVTEDNARTSAEDFATSVSGAASTTEAAPAKKKGLSDLEKAAIVGLGALAVGAILNNGSKVAANSGDRAVVQNPDGSYSVLKDDNALLRQPGSTIRTETFADGSTRTVATKQDGAQIVTVYDAQRRIVQRTRIEADGTRYVLVDDSKGADPVEVSQLPKADLNAEYDDHGALEEALARETQGSRRFTLAQVRQISAVRALAPAIAVNDITFATGSSAITPDQARSLADLGRALQQRIAANPREIFLVEGHTDAVGNDAFNLALSDRRAESVALALTEYFDVPAENLVVQGYGEEYLKVQTEGAEARNRRASVRRITDLLRMASN
ncbi:OmpA family protein [Phaeovulum sp. W22_SRMD_FR3]|uniref:OmpA family protein n=1 Tax=Phaeovulum sp. W22_SRMD_FR3 TaxID=3240274 RepID=UPI003F99010B